MRYRNIAVLFDADNIAPQNVETIMDKVSGLGTVTVRRAYGNWQNGVPRPWQEMMLRFAIRPIHQPDYESHKNSSDITLVIDAMDLMHSDNYDAFVIASGDADFMPLAIRLRESGSTVIGVGGGASVAKAFRDACDRFVIIGKHADDGGDAWVEDAKQGELRPSKRAVSERRAEARRRAEGSLNVHSAISTAYCNGRHDGAGWMSISDLGQYLHDEYGDFSPKAYGYSSIKSLLKSNPKCYSVRVKKNMFKVIK